MNLRKTNWKLTFAATALSVMGMACSLELAPQTSADSGAIDSNEYELRLEGSRYLTGSDTIPRRSESYPLEAKELPRLTFEERDTEWARSMLWRGGKVMFGDRIREAKEVIDDQLAALHLDGAVAWVDIRSGAYTFKRHDRVRGVTKVKDAREAVDRSLDQLARQGLLDLAEGVTLDVVGVTSTHYAAWYTEEAALRPVLFTIAKRGEEPVTRFKSEYTVYFGRRFKGVPIVGPAMMVRLDAAGELVALAKPWRDIGRTGRPDAVEKPDELPEFKTQNCGYLEGPAIAYRQESPGIGCVYFIENEEAGDPLSSMTSTTVSFNEDPDLDPIGEPVFKDKRTP